MNEEQAAKAAIKFFQQKTGADPAIIKHSPLYYSMVDLVTALLKLSAQEKFDWKGVMKDAREGIEVK